MSNGTDVERDRMLRSEIIESQKTQADFLKWKLIAVAAIASISLGLAHSPAVGGTKLLLCLVPLICAYVDLTSLHIMIRIMTIGIYLKESGDAYEKFVFAVRNTTGARPYVFEPIALHGSSIAFNAIIIALGFTLPVGDGNWPSSDLTAYIVTGALGIVTTVFFWTWYTSRVKEIIRVAKERRKDATTQESSR